MLSAVPQNHPKQKLLFFVAQDIDEALRGKVRDFVLQLNGKRSWLLGSPRFVNSRQEPDDTSKGDRAIETLGGYLELYSALPPLQLPRDVDLQHFNEATDLIHAIQEFSNREKLAFEFELDGTFVGSVTDGKMDRSLAQGLLGEWKRQLDKH